MTSTDRERITLLEAEIAELKSRLPPEKKPVPIVEDEGVRITYSRSTPIELPNHAESERLIEIVRRAYPRIVPDFGSERDRVRYLKGFTLAFWRIAHLRRGTDFRRASDLAVEAANYVHEALPGEWVDEVSSAFLTAALSAGDVLFTVGNGAQGVPWKLALGFHGEPARTAWREVLSRGAPRASGLAR